MSFCRYSIDYSQSDPITTINYFNINDTNGVISVYRSLELDTLRTSVYKLHVVAQDQGASTNSTTTTLLNYKNNAVNNLYIFIGMQFSDINRSISVASLLLILSWFQNFCCSTILHVHPWIHGSLVLLRCCSDISCYFCYVQVYLPGRLKQTST